MLFLAGINATIKVNLLTLLHWSDISNCGFQKLKLAFKFNLKADFEENRLSWCNSKSI